MKFDEAIQAVSQELDELEDMPEELNSFSIVTDQALAELISEFMHHYALRADDPIDRVGELLASINAYFLAPGSIEAMAEGRANRPELRPELHQAAQEVQRQRAMFLQWYELRNMETKEEE